MEKAQGVAGSLRGGESEVQRFEGSCQPQGQRGDQGANWSGLKEAELSRRPGNNI